MSQLGHQCLAWRMLKLVSMRTNLDLTHARYATLRLRFLAL